MNLTNTEPLVNIDSIDAVEPTDEFSTNTDVGKVEPLTKEQTDLEIQKIEADTSMTREDKDLHIKYADNPLARNTLQPTEYGFFNGEQIYNAYKQVRTTDYTSTERYLSEFGDVAMKDLTTRIDSNGTIQDKADLKLINGVLNTSGFFEDAAIPDALKSIPNIGKEMFGDTMFGGWDILIDTYNRRKKDPETFDIKAEEGYLTSRDMRYVRAIQALERQHVNIEDIYKSSQTKQKEDIYEYNAREAKGNFAASMIGGIGASFTDPLQVAAMAIPVAKAGASIGAVIGSNVAANTVASGASVAVKSDVLEDLEIEYTLTDALIETGAGGLMGGAIGTGFHYIPTGIVKGKEVYIKARHEKATTRLVEEAKELSKQIDEATTRAHDLSDYNAYKEIEESGGTRLSPEDEDTFATYSAIHKRNVAEDIDSKSKTYMGIINDELISLDVKKQALDNMKNLNAHAEAKEQVQYEKSLDELQAKLEAKTKKAILVGKGVSDVHWKRGELRKLDANINAINKMRKLSKPKATKEVEVTVTTKPEATSPTTKGKNPFKRENTRLETSTKVKDKSPTLTRLDEFGESRVPKKEYVVSKEENKMFKDYNMNNESKKQLGELTSYSQPNMALQQYKSLKGPERRKVRKGIPYKEFEANLAKQEELQTAIDSYEQHIANPLDHVEAINRTKEKLDLVSSIEAEQRVPISRREKQLHLDNSKVESWYKTISNKGKSKKVFTKPKTKVEVKGTPSEELYSTLKQKGYKGLDSADTKALLRDIDNIGNANDLDIEAMKMIDIEGQLDKIAKELESKAIDNSAAITKEFIANPTKIAKELEAKYPEALEKYRDKQFGEATRLAKEKELLDTVLHCLKL